MFAYARVRAVFLESCSLGWERKSGGTFHLKLNTHSSPIANKYREGKVQSTLERELNVPETVAMQAYCSCAWLRDCGTFLCAVPPLASANTDQVQIIRPASCALRCATVVLDSGTDWRDRASSFFRLML